MRFGRIKTACIAAALAAAAAALPCRLSAAEFEVVDKLTADGYTLLKSSADVSGWAFSVGGSSFSALYGKVGVGTSAPQALLHVSSAPGVSGDLFVISTAASNVIRMTGDGSVYANKFYGNFSGATGTPPGDNLGSHTGTQALNMGAYAVDGSSHVSAGYYQIAGATVIAIPGTSNLFVGPRAGETNTTGSYNVFVGSQSGYGSTTGAQTVSLGVQAGGGTGNVFTGYQAGAGVTSGSDIVGIGVQSAYFNAIGGYNTYGGYRSGYLNVNGSSNTCFGYQSCLNVRGAANTAIGSGALSGSGSPATVSSNTVMGYRAGYNLATGGSDNIFVGFQAGYNVTTGSGNIILGYDQRGAPADKMKLNIGGLIYGDLNATSGMRVGISTGSPAAKLEIAEIDASKAYSLKVGTSPSSYMLVVATSGNVGIGLASPLWPLHVYSRENAASGLSLQSAFVRPIYAKAAPGYSMTGLYSGSGAFHASGTLADSRGLSSIVKNMGAGTVTNAIAHYTRSCNNNILSTTTGTYPLFIGDSVETGAITNDYGLYQADTLARNYFAGPVKLGDWVYADSMFDVLANTGNAYSLRVGTGTSPSHLLISTSAAVGLNSAPTAARMTINDSAGAEFVRFSNSTTPDSSGLFSGSGTPEGAVTAQLGSLYSDYSGGKVYYKKSNDGASTGWEELLQPSTSVPRASMRLTTGVSVPANTWTQFPFNSVDYGVGPVATDTGTGSITVWQSGYYLLNAYWYHGALTTYDYMLINIFKNDVAHCEGIGWYPPGSAVELSVMVSCIEYLDAGDKITTQGYAYTALTTYSGGSADVQARMSVAMVNPAAIDISGSGTAGKLAKFTGTKAIGDSIITESSGRIGISSAVPTQALSVGGDVNFTSGMIYISSVPVIVAPPGDSTLKAGRNAAPSLTGSAYNVFIGNNAGYLAAGSAATYNTVVGHNSAYYLSSAAVGGSYNTYLGHSAGHYNTRGDGNACAGLWSCLAGKNSANTMLGYDTGSYGGLSTSTCTYSSNTVVGAQAGRNLCTGGSDNILLGRNAGYNIVTGSGNIVIGYYQQGAAADKMTLNIGGLIYGSLNGNTRRVGINAASPAAALHIASNGAMKPPVGTTAQRPGSPYAGMLRFNTTEARPEIYTVKWEPLAFSQPCHGGMVSFVGNDVVHTFYGSGTLRCDKPVTAQLLVVGGGGGGGYFNGGGGGGGGVVECASYSIPAGNTTVTVGAGGAVSGTTCGSYSSAVGGNSSFGAGVTAYGGGYGGGYGPNAGCSTPTAASAGGSGGGGYGSGAGGGGSASAGSYGGGCSGYAYAGGAGQASPAYGGGGGGAGGAGSAGSAGGAGGPGRASSISGASLYYGAGGGGNAGVGVTGGAIRVWFSGRPGFGSGSGADIWGGGAGGSGVVIIRYPGKAQN